MNLAIRVRMVTVLILASVRQTGIMGPKDYKTQNENAGSYLVRDMGVLVDAVFRQSGLIGADQEIDEPHMDTMEPKKERGITSAARTCSVVWNCCRSGELNLGKAVYT